MCQKNLIESNDTITVENFDTPIYQTMKDVKQCVIYSPLDIITKALPLDAPASEVM